LVLAVLKPEIKVLLVLLVHMALLVILAHKVIKDPEVQKLEIKVHKDHTVLEVILVQLVHKVLLVLVAQLQEIKAQLEQ
jgi:hypothetical protein